MFCGFLEDLLFLLLPCPAGSLSCVQVLPTEMTGKQWKGRHHVLSTASDMLYDSQTSQYLSQESSRKGLYRDSNRNLIRTARQQLVATALSPSPPHVVLASSPSSSGYHGTPCLWSRDRKELLIHLPVTKNTGLKKSGFWSKEDST